MSMIVVLAFPVAGAVGARGSTYLVGHKVENVSLKSLSGASVKLSDYKGKVILVNFFASW
jgi:cytochrome oxidase Cu insertion factor (SCO1/SenC/PrrC family)